MEIGVNRVAKFVRFASRWFALVAFCLASVNAYAADFSVDPDGAFRIRGNIAKGDFEKWKEFSRNREARLLRVTSGGGLAQEAIEIARDIHERQMDMEVDGICASACFIYLFVAAERKTLKPGALIGHHDSAQNMSMLPDQVKHEIRESVLGETPDLDEDGIEKNVRQGLREIQRAASMECSYAKEMGVNPAFYDDVAYVLADWREKFGGKWPMDAQALWWPSTSVLEQRYGISDIHGASRPDILYTRGWYFPPTPTSTLPPIIMLGDQYLKQAAAEAADADRLAVHAQCNYSAPAAAAVTRTFP